MWPRANSLPYNCLVFYIWKEEEYLLQSIINIFVFFSYFRRYDSGNGGAILGGAILGPLSQIAPFGQKIFHCYYIQILCICLL